MKILEILRRLISKIHILIRYKSAFYKINIIDGLYILDQILWLLTSRVLRFMKRRSKRLSDLLIVGACAIVFCLLIIPIGLNLNKYTTWYDGIWDLKTFFLTSILIVFVSNIVNEEKSRKKDLEKQFQYYVSFSYYAEVYIEKLASIIDFSYPGENIFLTNEHLSKFKSELSSYLEEEYKFIDINDNRYKSVHVYLNALNKRHLSELRYLLQLVNSINISNQSEINHLIWRGIDILEEEIMIIENNQEDYMPEDFADFLTNNLTNNQYLIAELRRPWRMDYEMDSKIRNLLVSKAEHVGENFDTTEYWE